MCFMPTCGMIAGGARLQDRPEGIIRLHLPRHLMAQAVPGPKGFYPRLMQDLAARGARVDVVWRDLEALETPCAAQDFDFVHQGRIARARALNTCVAYLDGFWYVDPKGIFGDSSLADARFDASLVPKARAQEFFDKQVMARVLARKSRYHQPSDRRSFGPGHIAVFLQTDSDPVARVQHMDQSAMMDAVLGHTGGRGVVVKPHPQDDSPETRRMLDRLARTRADVTVTDANVHDVLAGAAVSVSISSAASVEGLFHRVPAVVFGRTDFHHCAVTVQEARNWPQALDEALGGAWPFEAFVFWFFAQGAVPINWARFADTVIARMAAQGADLRALGLGG